MIAGQRNCLQSLRRCNTDCAGVERGTRGRRRAIRGVVDRRSGRGVADGYILCG